MLAGTAHRARHATPYAVVLLLLLSTLIYLYAFTLRFSLAQYVDTPLLDLGKIGGYDPADGWRFNLPLVVLWLLYGAVLRLAYQIHSQRLLLRLALAGGLGAGLILLWLYPITAADIFNYLVYGLVQHAGGNPLIVEPRSAIGAPIIDYSAWPAHPSPYGPVAQLLAWLITAMTGEQLLAGVIVYKGVLLLVHLGNTLLIARLSQHTPNRQSGVAALAYACNPLLLYEVIGNGHNDILLLSGLLLALLALTEQRTDFLALPAVFLAVLAKYIAALWLVPVGLGWLQRLHRERRYLPLLLAAIGSTGLLVIAFTPYWAGADTFAGLRRQSDLSTSSLVTLVMLVNDRLPEPFGTAALLDNLKVGIAAVLAVVALLSRPRSTTMPAVAGAAFDLLLAYLLLGAIWFQPWYLVPLVGLAPLVNQRRQALAVVYALSATATYTVYFYLWPYLRWTNDRLLIQTWAVLVGHGPVWLLLVTYGLWSLWQRGAAAHLPAG